MTTTISKKRTTITGLAVLLAIGVLATGCSEPAGPLPAAESGNPQGPLFAPGDGGGIALDRFNGKLGETVTIWQGFHPTNPRLGSAVVVTFYWIGSTNIITRVYDHLGDGTPVGNTYTQVEYVTAGGISMATYVATNVQGFPEGTYPNDDKSLIVHADLASPLEDGGITLSSYTGVTAVTADALGAHQSASGSGSSVTLADLGTLAVDAGALVYGVTMSNGRGSQTPSGFTVISVQSDPTIWAEADYSVQAGAGPVNPQWTWWFTAPSTWIASALVLRPAATQLAFTVQPSTTLPYTTIQPAVTVTARDAVGNAATSFNGPVTIAIGNNAGLLMSGTLSGTRTVNAVNGVATFSDLSIDQLGNGYTLQATASGLTGAVSAAFNIGAF